MSEFRAAPGGAFLRRGRVWYGVLCAVIFLSGNISGAFGGGFVRFTSWYIDDANRAAALKALGVNSDLILKRLDVIDQFIRDQTYANQIVAQVRLDYAEHLHALDVRADADRASIADLHEQVATQKERVLYLLDPKGRK